MAEKKKIFNESDFDKDKRLFTSEDFEKNKDAPKKPKPESSQKPGGANDNGGGNGRVLKIFGGIAATVVAGLLCYGGYSYFSSSDVHQDDESTNQVEKVSGTSTEEDNKDTSNVEIAGTPETEAANSDNSANDESVTVPEQDISVDASSPQSEPKQGGVTMPNEPSKATTQSAQRTTSDSPSVTLSGSLEEKAKEVIRGNFGNGEVRKQKLGEHYSEIQNKVNEMYRQGLVR